MGGGWVTPIMLTSELPLEGNPESPQNCLLVHLSIGNPESVAAICKSFSSFNSGVSLKVG